MKADDKYRYEVEFTFGITVTDHEAPDPADYVQHITGAIMRHERMKETEPIKIGTLTLVLMDIAAGIDAGYSAYEVADSSDAESASYGEILFETNGETKPEIVNGFETSEWISRVLILEVVKIEPNHRGRNAGLLAARSAIEFFGHDAFIMLKPFPLQFNEYQSPDWVAPKGVTDKHKDFARARKKLEGYWKRLGCRKIGRTGYWGMHSTDDLPSAEDILKSRRNQSA
jgi:hypothetical protein